MSMSGGSRTVMPVSTTMPRKIKNAAVICPKFSRSRRRNDRSTIAPMKAPSKLRSTQFNPCNSGLDQEPSLHFTRYGRVLAMKGAKTATTISTITHAAPMRAPVREKVSASARTSSDREGCVTPLRW